MTETAFKPATELAVMIRRREVGAALAVGLTGIEAGSDIGSSIRNSVHYCGMSGIARDGLPGAVQIVGPYLGDRTCIHTARPIERHFGGFQPPPGY